MWSWAPCDHTLVIPDIIIDVASFSHGTGLWSKTWEEVLGRTLEKNPLKQRVLLGSGERETGSAVVKIRSAYSRLELGAMLMSTEIGSWGNSEGDGEKLSSLDRVPK